MDGIDREVRDRIVARSGIPKERLVVMGFGDAARRGSRPPQGRVTFAASGTNVLLRVPAGHIAREHLTHLPGAEGVGDAEIDFWCPHDGGYVRVAGGRRPQVCKSLQATGPALEVSGVEDMEHVLRREFSRLSRGLQPERDAWDQGR